MIYTSRMSPSINSVNIFLVNLCILIILLAAPLFMQLSTAQTTASKYQEIESILFKHGEVIVKVHFDDANKAREFGLGLEPMESDYQKGYLVFHLTRGEYEALSSGLDGTGMSMELDQALTRP